MSLLLLPLPSLLLLSQLEFFLHNYIYFLVLSQLEFLSQFVFWVTISLFKFLSQFHFFSFVPIWVFGLCHNLCFWVLSQFEFVGFVTIWVFDFCHTFRMRTIHYCHYCHNCHNSHRRWGNHRYVAAKWPGYSQFSTLLAIIDHSLPLLATRLEWFLFLQIMKIKEIKCSTICHCIPFALLFQKTFLFLNFDQF